MAVQQQNEVLGQKVALLEQEIARLSKDSSTSPKPPSSDITRAPRRDKPGRRKEAGKPPNGEKRKQGGQPGQPRHNRALLPAEVVGRVQHYGLGCCPRCDGEEVRLVEEYRAYAYYCTDCETIQYAEVPEAVV